MTPGRTYAIYYGWLTDGAHGEPNAAAASIAAAAPPLLIASYRTAAPAGHVNLSPAVLAALHAAGTAVYAYVATGFGRADASALAADIAEYVEAGADGVFFDEADPLVASAPRLFYLGLARCARGLGAGVIANPGVAACGEALMDVADRVMLEHRWREFAATCPWRRRYPAERYMGVSSDEERAMGYAMDARRAVADTREAWASGIGWHTSTQRYTALPPWFADYVAAVSAGSR